MTTIASELRLPCGLVLQNRLAKAAMTEGLADSHNRATDRHVRLYRRWAEGGLGLSITGNVQVHRQHLERPGNVCIAGPQDRDQLSRLERWAQAGSSDGCALFVQLSHAGRQTPVYVNERPLAPSAVGLQVPGGQFGKPREMGEADIESVIAAFAYAAGVAKATGFAGVQVHGAHGYLLSEFLSPRVNLRRDRWGGPLEHRARLLLDVVRAVRAAVGPDYAVAVKLNSADFQKGGFSHEDCVQVVEWLGAEGIDLLEISGGTYEQPRLLGIEGLEPLDAAPVPRSTAAREAYFLDYAASVRDVARMPLMVTGGFRSLTAMNEALGTGAADLIGLARPLCTDPELPGDLLSGVVTEAPRWEDVLALGPGRLLGPRSPAKLLKATSAFATMAWYYEQLYRLADDLPANRRLLPARALLSYVITERRKALALRAD